MSKILLILTILLTGAAAFFGFQTKTKIGGLVEAKTTAETNAKAAAASLGKAKDDLSAAKDQAASAKDEATRAAAEAAAAKAAADKAVADKADVEKKLADVQKQLDDSKASSTTGSPTGTDNSAQIAELQTKLKDAEAKCAEAQQLTTTLQAKVKDAEDKAQALAQYKAHREGQIMAKGLEGQVMAVNQGWNFVVVSIGDRQGAVANSQMIVKRGDTMVGKVRISSVEPATSIADIIPDSVPRGQRVMPGDRVIYTGQ